MLKFDSLFEFAAPAYDDRQISFLLSSAQEKVFINRYYSPANKFQRGFEFDEKRRKDLAQLVKSASIENGDIEISGDQTGVHPNGVFYNMPEGYLYSIEETAKLGESNVEIPVKPVRHDEYIANIKNPYKKPYSGLVWRMDIGREIDPEGGTTHADINKRVELITDGTNISDYRVRYLRMPPAIIVDEFDPSNQKHCVLDESLHELIVEEAVKIARANVKPESYEVSMAEKNDLDN